MSSRRLNYLPDLSAVVYSTNSELTQIATPIKLSAMPYLMAGHSSASPACQRAASHTLKALGRFETTASRVREAAMDVQALRLHRPSFTRPRLLGDAQAELPPSCARQRILAAAWTASRCIPQPLMSHVLGGSTVQLVCAITAPEPCTTHLDSHGQPQVDPSLE